MSANSNSTSPTGSPTPSTSTVTSVSSISSSTSDTSTTFSTTTISSTTSQTPTTSSIISTSLTPTSTSEVTFAITSTAPGNIATTITVTSRITPSSPTDAAATTTSAGVAGSLSSQPSSGSGGSSNAGTIVPAVVVPVVVVALLILGGVWFFRRRRATKEAEELRRKEVEEYGFNPNTDTAFGGSAVAGTTATNDNAAAMSEVDGSGYRGWGATNSARKASTTLGSASVGAAAIGLARSDSGENGAYQANGQPSPNGPNGNASYSDHNSGDPLVHQSRPISQDYEGVAALGAGPAAGSRNNGGVHRGPSNASSAYSGGQRSDTSGEIGTAIGSPTWGNEYLPEDGPYGAPVGAPPVIRDVSARRNTRIEQPTVMPQQPRGGISQNF